MSRFRDHRLWIMGIGLGSFLATIGMFFVLPSQFFPTTNSDFSRVSIEMVPGTTIKQTEVVADKVAAIINEQDRKSTRLNSSHANISYAVFCLKKKQVDNT